MIRIIFAAALAPALALAGLVWEARAETPCAAPKAVCAAAGRVFPIASFDPMGSSVLIEPGLLVTNRHLIADNRRAEVFLKDGSRILADVVPSGYAGDLILLKAPALSGEGPIETAPADAADELFTVGADVNCGRVRVYGPGRMLLPAALGKPLARLHHTAVSQPGNSGGALVNGAGKLVAIVTSGRDGRFEAIPTSEIARLKAQSGDAFIKELQNSGDTEFWSVAARLAQKKHIAPLASRDIVGQATPAAIVHDAETTHGGSGGPVLNIEGKVVAVNAAILPEFGGSNLGVPVSKVRELLADLGLDPSQPGK